MGTTMFKKDLYKIAFDENEDLEKRWEALEHIRDHQLHNPSLGEIEQFLKDNQGLVHMVARKSMRKTKIHVEYEDLIQEGNIGLIKAYCYYDHNKEIMFSTYASYHISNMMMRYIRDLAPMIRTPRHIHELAGKILKRKLDGASVEEVSKKIGCTIYAATTALNHLNNPKTTTSLNITISDSTQGATELMDIIPTEQDFSEHLISEFSDCLTDQQRVVMELTRQGQTQSQVGEEIGCSQAHAGRILKQVRERAKDFFENEGIA